ncbi:MAG: ROK family protein, partial [Candidatus Margulisiibacteriota bacterium]
MKQNIIGIDIGATKTIVALASASGEILKEKAFKSQDLLKSIVDTIKELSPENDFSSIGIGCPRLFMEESKRLLSELIEKDLSLAFNKKIVIVNDAQAGALGEYKFGSGVGSKNMIYITVSTGVGAGLILNGLLYKGSFGMAGEAGHVSMNIAGPGCACGNFGCLHMLVS